MSQSTILCLVLAVTVFARGDRGTPAPSPIRPARQFRARLAARPRIEWYDIWTTMKTRLDRRAAMLAIGASVIPLAAQTQQTPVSRRSATQKEKGMQLGTFSISLAVKDLQASKAFYEKFGFKSFAGNPAQNWLIMKNGDHVIGLFQGMFEKNILTFNPGWDSNAQKLAEFTDVRELQRQLKAQGVKMETEANESTTGPASLIVVDPDGNPILLDQHV
jgi:lactoylglutathione lyase